MLIGDCLSGSIIHSSRVNYKLSASVFKIIALLFIKTVIISIGFPRTVIDLKSSKILYVLSSCKRTDFTYLCHNFVKKCNYNVSVLATDTCGKAPTFIEDRHVSFYHNETKSYTIRSAVPFSVRAQTLVHFIKLFFGIYTIMRQHDISRKFIFFMYLKIITSVDTYYYYLEVFSASKINKIIVDVDRSETNYALIKAAFSENIKSYVMQLAPVENNYEILPPFCDTIFTWNDLDCASDDQNPEFCQVVTGNPLISIPPNATNSESKDSDSDSDSLNLIFVSSPRFSEEVRIRNLQKLICSVSDLEIKKFLQIHPTELATFYSPILDANTELEPLIGQSPSAKELMNKNTIYITNGSSLAFDAMAHGAIVICYAEDNSHLKRWCKSYQNMVSCLKCETDEDVARIVSLIKLDPLFRQNARSYQEVFLSKFFANLGQDSIHTVWLELNSE